MSLEIEIPSLLEPFEGSFRGGTDLREDDDPNNAYRRIRDARNEAREEERQSDLSGEASADAYRRWREVWEEGQEYLRVCAKDLEIVAYMIEASIRLGGYAGLAQALSLTRELVDAFWGELLPTPDEDGVETTLRPLSRLNGDVITYPMMRVPVTDDTAVGRFVVWQFAQARQLESMSPEERETRVASGAVTIEMFNRAVAETRDPFYQELSAEIEQARAAVKQLEETLEEKAGDAEAPNLSRFVKALEEAEATVRQIAGDRLTEAGAVGDSVSAVGAADNGGGGAGSSATSTGTSTPVGGIGNRNDALNVLETVAKWFEKHEPQSFLPAEIRKAVRRGRMSPLELYQDLISDSDVRRQLFRDIGIHEPEGEY